MTSKFCVYCSKKKVVKLWRETNEYVCLACRLLLLAQEFEGVETKQEVDQVRYYASLMEVNVV